MYLYHGSKYNYYCVITQTLQNGQTLGQFFELLYSGMSIYCPYLNPTNLIPLFPYYIPWPAPLVHWPDWSEWEQAIEEELATIRDAGTWILVELPAGANIVGLKWVFQAKKDTDDNVVQKKAHLIAQGFSQVLGVDYFNTFAPVACLASICTIMALAAHDSMEIDQINIKGAYLNGKLTPDEVIYMHQPPGYASQEHP